MKYHLTPLRMAIITKAMDNKCWRGCGEEGTLVPCWWEGRLVQPLWKTVWNFLRKFNMELHFDLAIPLLGLYPENPSPIFPFPHTLWLLLIIIDFNVTGYIFFAFFIC